MHKNCHRWSITPAVLVILCVLTAVVVSGTGAASASARIDTSEAASDIRPDDVASTFENASAQALRDRVPATLFPAVTATLQSTGTSDMYEAIPGLSGERAYRLENPPHSMSAEFDTLGVSISSGNEGKWTWSLRFAGYARGRAVGPVEDAHLTADSNRVEYRYPDGVTEWYVNGPLGLQQGFTFESRLVPSVDGTLEVRMALSGDVRWKLMRVERRPFCTPAKRGTPFDMAAYTLTTPPVWSSERDWRRHRADCLSSSKT